MNEQLQSKLVEVLSGIQSATKAAGDFAMEQLPDIAQSYVMYGRALHTTYLLIGLLMLGALLWFMPRALKAFEAYESWPLVYVPGSLLAAVAIISNLGPAFLVWFAPKVWLLKALAELIK